MSATGVQLEVRAARGADAPNVVELLASIYEEDRWFVGDGPPAPSALARRIRGDARTDVLFLVAAEGPRVVGWLELQRLAPRKLRHVAVLTLAVSGAHRRRGIATRLLHEAYAWARHQGVCKVTLNVRANNRAAIALYMRESFVREGREERHIRTGAGWEDNLIMARFLEEAPAG